MTTGNGSSSSSSNINNRDSQNDRALPDLVSQWYYKHGLFLSSYPTCATCIALIVFFISCYPLVNIPLPGTIPTKVVLPFEEKYLFDDDNTRNHSLIKNIFNVNNTFDPPFPWAQNKPLVFVQQILLRSAVYPWSSDLQLMDAYRAPLYEVFKLLEIIRNHESLKNFDNLCLHVENVKRKQKDPIFPEYNCLIISPANFWNQDAQNFSKDGSILNTIFQQHGFQKGKVSIAEMLLGVPLSDSGFKRYPLRSRSRVIQYAITLILQSYDKTFIESLKHKLTLHYPLYQKSDFTTKDNADESSSTNNININHPSSSIMYIYYPGEFRIGEFMPIFTAFTLLFIYVYFSVRKIDVIRSRLFLATSAVFTVLGSLMMSLGLCFFFGLTISLQSKGIYPYLVILVGLENCLVITKSVVSTDETFDVKIRVAQALSNEGWHISKTLLTEITILTVGLATFVPKIQEFCVFAVIGLISDYILQMFFFSTGLAMNIKRMEYTAEARNIPKIMSFDHKHGEFKKFNSGLSSWRNNINNGVAGANNSPFHRSHSYPKLSFHELNKTNNSAEQTKRNSNNNSQEQKIPKRLKIVNFWARTRFFQRAFMIWMSIWIFSIVYDSEFLQNFFVMDMNSTSSSSTIISSNPTLNLKLPIKNMFNFKNILDINEAQAHAQTSEKVHKVYSLYETEDNKAQFQRLQYPDFEINYYLSNFHWSAILKQYNITIAGKYITILPTIKLSKAIQPEIATVLRNPKDQIFRNFQWKTLAAALDPLDFNDEGKTREIPPKSSTGSGSTPLYPKSPMEIFIVAMLCAISVFVLTYTMIVFYRCICTRNYAEWRSSWNEKEIISNDEEILDGIPLNLRGHTHNIECLVSDGVNVVSCCLKGEIKVWDSENGEMITKIERTTGDFRITGKNYSPVWCMDYLDNLVALGCANGRIEFWEIPTGKLKCIYQEDVKDKNGVTHIILTGNRVIAAKLCGRLNFYRLETYYKGKQIDWGFTSAYRRTHVRTGSTGSIGFHANHEKEKKEEITCTLEEVKIAHQQPFTCIEIANGIIFTGSKDHTLRVYNLYDPDIEFTLHGHCGPITCLFVDKWQSGTGGSASQNGDLCVWDIFTGACMYNIQAHDGSISSLVCAPSYVISLGTDERVCVWERFQGNLLSTINISNAYSKLCMLTPSLLVTSKAGSLMVWDVRSGEPAREVKLGGDFSQVSPKIMILAGSSVFCDYGNQIKIVKFPIVADKCN